MKINKMVKWTIIPIYVLPKIGKKVLSCYATPPNLMLKMSYVG